MTDSAEPSHAALAAGRTAPMRFLADGTLVSLRVDGREFFRELRVRSGFFVLWFDGAQVREIPLPHVVVVDEFGIRVVADNDFPRLDFSISTTAGSLRVALARVEGMPAERDVSVGFRIGLAFPCEVIAVGKEAITKLGDQDLRVFWPGAGQVTSDHGGFILTPKHLR